MPNRIIKDSIRTSRSINAMTDFQFRLWAYLITYVDDYGRGSADPELLKGFVFPRRKGVSEATIQKTLAELATMGSVTLYEVDGEPYLCFPNWSEHQTVRNKVSKFPAPKTATTCNQLQADECNCNQLQADEFNCSRNPESRIQNPESGIRNPEESKRATRFTPPTAEDVAAYCAERRNRVDPERFVDFYAAKGWKIGKESMKDWKAAVRTWEKRDQDATSDTFAAVLREEYNRE